MTFVSSKVLVGLLDPCWYIVIRFFLAWGFLFLLSPKPMKLLPKKQERRVALCGIAGVAVISFAGGGSSLHLLGDAFALAAAIAWGVYCVLIAGTEEYGLSELQMTRKIFSGAPSLPFLRRCFWEKTSP